jgi:hypothetical protein
MWCLHHVEIGNLSLMEKLHGADVEDEIVGATIVGKGEVSCRYVRGGAYVGIKHDGSQDFV